MPIFRKSRRPTPISGASADEPAAPPRPQGLADRLREIAEAASAPEEALEPALRAILEATGARAGAVGLFDQRHGILRLAVESGLSEQGCRRLRSVRRGDPTAWDMPLHGLLNRRAYLIESAARNRYVPRLIDGPGTIRTIACIPLYAHRVPLGSLLLVAVAPRAFVERDLQSLERPLRELIRLIEAVRRQGATAEEPAPRRYPRLEPVADISAALVEAERLREEVAARATEGERLRRELAAATAEQERLRAALAGAEEAEERQRADLSRLRGGAERAESLAAALAAAEQERARLAVALERAAAERTILAEAQRASERARSEAERAAESARDEIESARQDAEARAASAAAEAAARGNEIERLLRRVAEAEMAIAAERDRRRDREQETERVGRELAGALARESELRETLRSATSAGADAPDIEQLQTLARVATEQRAALEGEARTLRAELASSQAIIEALEEEATRTHGDIERLELAEGVAQTDHDRLESALIEATGRVTQTRQRMLALEREVAGLERERAALAGAVREAEAKVETVAARLESIAAERDRLREGLAAITSERDRHASELDARAETDGRLRTALANETAERTRLVAELRRAEEAAHERQAAASAQAAQAERLTAERNRLAAQLETALSDLAPAEPDQPVRVVTVAPSAAGKAASRDATATEPLVAVVDDDPAWASAAFEGHRVEVLAPGEDIVARLAELEPARIILNLAAPGALESLRAIREGGSTARVWGCLATPGAGQACPLGMVEPANRPLEPDAILTALGDFAGRGTRVITAGADVDALMSLRQAFARKGMSVSMAWDGKQATELLGVVRPEIVVVDLELPRGDGYPLVASLGALDPLPVIVLVAGAQDPASGFATLLGDARQASAAIPYERLLAQLVRRSEAAPAERRQKLRSLGRGK